MVLIKCSCSLENNASRGCLRRLTRSAASAVRSQGAAGPGIPHHFSSSAISSAFHGVCILPPCVISAALLSVHFFASPITEGVWQATVWVSRNRVISSSKFVISKGIGRNSRDECGRWYFCATSSLVSSSTASPSEYAVPPLSWMTRSKLTVSTGCFRRSSTSDSENEPVTVISSGTARPGMCSFQRLLKLLVSSGEGLSVIRVTYSGSSSGRHCTRSSILVSSACIALNCTGSSAGR